MCPGNGLTIDVKHGEEEQMEQQQKPKGAHHGIYLNSVWVQKYEAVPLFKERLRVRFIIKLFDD